MKTLIEFDLNQLLVLCKMTDAYGSTVSDVAMEIMIKAQQENEPAQVATVLEQDRSFQKMINQESVCRQLLDRFKHEHVALQMEIEQAEQEGRATKGTLSPSLAGEVIRLQGELPQAIRLKLEGMEAQLLELQQRVNPTLEWVTSLREDIERREASTDEQAKASTDNEGPLNAPLSEA